MVKPVDRITESIEANGVCERLHDPSQCRIVVLGVGGAGNNTITRLMEMSLTDTECIAINTDKQHLNATNAAKKILIGEKTTHGIGAGGDPKIGKAAIEESRKRIEKLLTDTDAVFIAVGLGGGTGTGAAPIIAEIARGKGATVVGVVTMPFRIEKGRIQCATEGLREMQSKCDTIVIIDNDKLMGLAPHLPLNEAFRIADQVLANMIKGIVETISEPSLINLDFADFKTVVKKGGVAIIGIGESDAPNRAEEAVRNALRSPLFNIDYEGATGALVHVSGDDEMTIEEANRVGEIVTEMMSRNATVAWGAKVNPDSDGALKVTLLMTGVSSPLQPSWLGMIMSKIRNIDPYPELEEPLGINLGLDQIENFEQQ
ncbi:MAG: cell division protein FtsZ [Candidatus Bathyarchaeota archaeon]|nr:cell division protein FtsZ [Candidatus Bathyarchaeota archaeon]MDH5733430.1 cell division protein FtsZ [Candidatus Bathyarchaeota archaeon]